ncbi:pantetheinase [Biomphalaria glabrata]|nr:pantetheinase [Biomphalaria glabrata]
MGKAVRLLLLLLGALSSVLADRSKFKGAVYGHAVLLPKDSLKVISRAEALDNMNKNLDVYREQVSKAKSQGAEIIVFPEDGLYGFQFTRQSIYPYLEYIPDPRTELWSPCGEPGRYNDTEVQRSLSCLAKTNSLYLVANMGDKQPCDVATDRTCPPDGRYQYNTNVVYGPDGTLLARYHKYNLFYELQFNAPELELSYFDTPFGRFGLMICFDVLFHDPGLPLILSLNISNIIFTSAWMDALPLLSALGYHSSFARGLGINMLGANIHIPDYRFHGSGIYGPDGTIISFYGSTNASKPKLLVADVNVLDDTQPNKIVSSIVQQNWKQARMKEADIKRVTKDTTKNSKKTFESLLFYDMFTFAALDKPSGHIKVNQKHVHCELRYSIPEELFGRELYAFGAFDGLHTYEGQYYFQICALVKCADARNRSTCGSVTFDAITPFVRLSISGEMQTPFVYPQIILSNGIGELSLAEPDSWTFTGKSLKTVQGFYKPVLSAALFGRDYLRDTDGQDKGDNLYKSQEDATDKEDKSEIYLGLLSGQNIFIFLLGFVCLLLLVNMAIF